MLIIEGMLSITLDKKCKQILTTNISTKSQGRLIGANNIIDKQIRNYFNINTAFYGLKVSDNILSSEYTEL